MTTRWGFFGHRWVALLCILGSVALVSWPTGAIEPAAAAGSAPVLVSPADGALLTFPTQPPVLRWQRVRKAAEYRVQIDDEPNFTGAVEYLTESTVFVPTEPQTAGQLFFWRVQAELESEKSTAWSTPRSYLVEWPSRPTLTEPQIASTVEDVVLRWEPQLGAATYQLQISPNGDWANNVSIDQVVKGTGYSPPATLNNASYFWRVRGRDAATSPNLSDWSDEYSITRMWDAPTTDPTTRDGFADPMLSWSPVTKASHYEIQYGFDANFSPGTFASCYTNHTRWTFGEIVPGGPNLPLAPGLCRPPPCPRDYQARAYYWRVRAIDAPTGVNGVFSNVSPFPFFDGTCPKLEESSMAKDVLTPEMYLTPCGPDNTCTVGDTPTFKWQRVNGTTSYLLYVALDPNFTNIVRTYKIFSPQRRAPFTTFTPRESLFDNQAGQSYYWFVRPCEFQGILPEICGPFDSSIASSNAASFRKSSPAVELTPAVTPYENQVVFDWRDYLATNLTSPSIDLLQSPAQEAKQYRIQVSATNDFAVILDDKIVDQTVYTPFDRTYPEGKLFWRVHAIDGSGNLLTASTIAELSKASPRVELLTPASRATIRAYSFEVFSWAPQTYAAGYELEVYRNGDVHFSPGNRVITQSTKASAWAPYTVFEPGRYAWRVRRIDADRRPGPWSQGRRFTIKR